MASKAEVIQKMIEPVINALGFDLWGLEYLGQGRHTLLRIYLDKAGGINIEDCAETSRQISSLLDVEDPIKDEYTLEVSSPGMDRILFKAEHYRMYLNSKLKIRLGGSAGGRRNFTGTLLEVTGTGEDIEIVVKADGEDLRFPLQSIEKANLVIED
jgi:ribosome maturation factor RimP